jgi:hypothetical protein
MAKSHRGVALKVAFVGAARKSIGEEAVRVA